MLIIFYTPNQIILELVTKRWLTPNLQEIYILLTLILP